MLEWKSEGLGGGLAERQKEEQRPGRDRQRARGEGRRRGRRGRRGRGRKKMHNVMTKKSHAASASPTVT